MSEDNLKKSEKDLVEKEQSENKELEKIDLNKFLESHTDCV